MGKIVNLEDIQYLRALNALPKTYSIDIVREVDTLSSAEDWDEVITWEVSDPDLDNAVGDVLVFNHLLTVVHHMVTFNETLRSQLIEYMAQELNLEIIDHDSNFNK